MFPRLSDLIYYFFGINIPLPVATFGFFVAISFSLAYLCFVKEMERKEKEGLLFPNIKKVMKGESLKWWDLLISIITGFAVGYKLGFAATHYSAFVDNPPAFILSMEGSVLFGFVGAIAFGYMKYSEKKKEKLAHPQPIEQEIKIRPHEHVANMTIIAAVAGLLGAKIFHNLENLNEFLADPIGALISFSGLTMYGGLICGSIAVLIYARKQGLDMRHVIDSCAPGLMLSYGTGRIGCHLSGDGDWGIVNTLAKPLAALPDWMWSFKYPHNVLSEGIPIPGCEGRYCFELPEGVFPTAFYEAVMCITLFLVLWTVRKKINIAGQLFSLYLILNGIERFCIEKIRVNTEYNILGGITQAEIISTILFILGVIGIIYFNRIKTKKYSNTTANAST